MGRPEASAFAGTEAPFESLGAGKGKLGPTWCPGLEEVPYARVSQFRAFSSSSHISFIPRRPGTKAFTSVCGDLISKGMGGGAGGRQKRPITESITKERQWRNLPPFGRPGEADLSSSFGAAADLGFLD